jgi:hypothetical protein
LVLLVDEGSTHPTVSYSAVKMLRSLNLPTMSAPDRPLPLALRSPSSTAGFAPSPSSIVSSRGPPPQGSSDDLSVRESSVGSYDSFFQQVITLEDVGQIDDIIDSLQYMKAVFSSRET